MPRTHSVTDLATSDRGAMCNCGKGRRANQVARTVVGGGGGGCVGPGCRTVSPQPPAVVRAVPTAQPVVTPTPTLSVRSRDRRTPTPPGPSMPSTPVMVMEELTIVDPMIWGPAMWRFLHIASENSAASPTRKRVWDNLLNAMLTGLPCPECTEHYTAWYTTHPFVIPARGANVQVAIREWLRGLHNAVNARRGVTEWSGDAVSAAYSRAGAFGGDLGVARRAAQEALAEAETAGVGSWVIAAGREVVERAML